MNAATALTRQRCWTHPPREAAARCPSCERFFCRECVTEHEGRFLCTGCLRALLVAAQPASRQRTKWALASLGRAAQIAVGVLLTWFFFYNFAQALSTLPTAFHEGTLWRDRFFGEE